MFTDIQHLPADVQAAIERLRQAGITRGVTATEFAPDGLVTRWQMAVFLDRIVNGADQPDPAPPPVPEPETPVLPVTFEGGSETERQVVLAALDGSDYPWERLTTSAGQPWPINVRFVDGYTAPKGGRGGMTFPAGNLDILTGSVTHELGHVLDGRLLTWELREAIRRRFCDHAPTHQWVGKDDDDGWGLRVTEDFANAYAFLFHQGQRGPGASHQLDQAGRTWLRELILAADPADQTWI